MGSVQIKPDEIETRLFINGEFVPSISGKKFDVVNPATEEVSASVYEGDVADVDVAVAAAKAAFPAWCDLSGMERGHYLNKLADALDAKIAEFAYLDAITMGRPVSANAAMPAILRYFAGKAMDITGESSLNTPGMVNITLRQPYGVCAAIIPWNAAVSLLLIKIGPALVAGNTLVVKSSEKAPLSSLLVAKCAQEIGLPKGVLNILSGYGRPCGEAIAKHMEIRKLSFTGSAPTGRAIKKAAADSNLKRVTLELGGKSPLIIFEDADLEKAIPQAAFSIINNAGQICMASSRVYVHEAIAEKFIDGMKAAMTALGTSGDPTLTESKMGPQVDKLQFDRVMSYLDYAKKSGLDFLLGGDRDSSHGAGYYVQPAIIKNAPEDSKVMKEEIFGPVVCINTFTDDDEVLNRANDTEYGLYASLFTRDISRAMRIAKKLEAGYASINCTSPMVSLDTPMAPWKQSGDGCELSRYATDVWTQLKSVLIAL